MKLKLYSERKSQKQFYTVCNLVTMTPLQETQKLRSTVYGTAVCCQEGIRHQNLTPKPLILRGQPANPDLPGKWPSKRCECMHKCMQLSQLGSIKKHQW